MHTLTGTGENAALQGAEIAVEDEWSKIRLDVIREPSLADPWPYRGPSGYNRQEAHPVPVSSCDLAVDSSRNRVRVAAAGFGAVGDIDPGGDQAGSDEPYFWRRVAILSAALTVCAFGVVSVILA